MTLTNIANAVSSYPDLVSNNNAVTNLVFVEPPPLLSVNFNPPDLVLLSWSSSHSNYALQFNPDLLTFDWSNVLTAPVTGGGTNVVTETNLNPAMYYRLKR